MPGMNRFFIAGESLDPNSAPVARNRSLAGTIARRIEVDANETKSLADTLADLRRFGADTTREDQTIEPTECRSQ